MLHFEIPTVVQQSSRPNRGHILLLHVMYAASSFKEVTFIMQQGLAVTRGDHSQVPCLRVSTVKLRHFGTSVVSGPQLMAA